MRRRMGVAAGAGIRMVPGAAGTGSRRSLATHALGGSCACSRWLNASYFSAGMSNIQDFLMELAKLWQPPMLAAARMQRLLDRLLPLAGCAPGRVTVRYCHLPLVALRHCRPVAQAGWQAAPGVDCAPAGQGRQAARVAT